MTFIFRNTNDYLGCLSKGVKIECNEAATTYQFNVVSQFSASRATKKMCTLSKYHGDKIAGFKNTNFTYKFSAFYISLRFKRTGRDFFVSGTVRSVRDFNII